MSTRQISVNPNTENTRSSLPNVVSRPPEWADGTGTDALLRLWERDREELEAEMHLAGALLFRGFDISETDHFQAVMAQMKSSLLDYIDGNSPRTKVGGGVYTSTEYPPDYFISLHNELSYSSSWPKRLFFCCIVEPAEGGETPLIDSRTLLNVLPTEIVEAFRAKQIKYIRNLHSGNGFGPSWQKTFATEDPREAERYANASGMNSQWLTDGILRLWTTRPATTHHPVTGEEVWFNQADQFHPTTHPEPIYKAMRDVYKNRIEWLPQNATFGDDSPIPEEWLQTIRQVTRENLTTFPWQRGDLLMVDNVLAAHGRMPFKGPRKILVAMTSK